MSFSYLAYYQVSAQSDLEARGKFTSLSTYKADCISDAVATEELCSEVHLRTLSTHSIIAFVSRIFD
jgi:hypothetical protein